MSRADGSAGRMSHGGSSMGGGGGGRARSSTQLPARSHTHSHHRGTHGGGGHGSGGGGGAGSAGGGSGNHEVSTGSPPLRDVSFVPDSMAEACFRCSAAFTFTRRKHHCRSCGNVVCANCSGKRVVLHASKTTKDTGTDESVRVCDACFTAHCAKHLPRYVPHPRSRHSGGAHAHKASHSGGGGGGGGGDFAPQRSFYEASTSASGGGSNSGPSSARHSTSAAFAPAGATLDPLGNLVLQAETQPWVGDDAGSTGGGYGYEPAPQGWGTNLTEAGGRWFSSFFFADPSANMAAAASAAAAAAAASNAALAASPNGGSSSPHAIDPAGTKPMLMINPNHIADAGADAQSGAQSLTRGPLSLSRFGTQSQPLLTPESHKSFVLLLFNTYCCVNPLEEKIKLHVPDVLFHGLPRKHIDLLANEAEIDEHLTRKCRAYLNHVIARVRASRESWMQFMEGYEYVGEAENNHSDSSSASSASPGSPSEHDPLPAPYASPPPFLSYPSPPPPLCTGTMLITNFQTVFIPDYAVYVFFDHTLCVEERKRWHRKRAAVRRSVAKAREERAEQERRRRAAEAINGIPSVAESPEDEISLTGSRSPSPSASPGLETNGTGNALMHSVSLDQVAEVLATATGVPQTTASPMPIPTAASNAAPNMQRSLSETNIAADPTSPLIVQPLVVTVDAAFPASSASPEIPAAPNSNTAATSSSGSLSPDGGVQVTLSPAASVSRTASPMPSMQTIPLEQSPLGQNSSSPPPPPLSSSQHFNAPAGAASGSVSASSVTNGSSPSMSGSSIFASYRNLSQLHLPHYRLYQQTKYADPASSSAATGDPAPVDEFDPLAFAPPLISVPLLSLRKLRHFTFETKDTGFLELKTKFHHALLRFVLTSLVKAQRFSSFKNLTKCLEHYSTFAAPGAAGGSAGLPPPPSAPNRSSSVAGSASSGAGSGASGSSISADDTEIKQKCFAFRHSWASFLQQQQLSPRSVSSARRASGGDMAEALASSPCDPGWGLYDALREYRRLGLAPDPRSPVALPFRVSSVNHSYTFCPSYPRHLVVPLYVSDSDLLALAHFRSKRRIPSLVWSGPFPRAPVLPMRAVEPLAPEGMVGSIRARRALILRSAQPLTGITGQRNAEDEALLQHACAAVGADRLLIVDARPMANAIGQSALGAGYENTVWYAPREGGTNYGKLYASFNSPTGSSSLAKTPVSPPFSLRETQIAFMNCENIHAVRKSHHMLEKLIQKSWEEDAELGGYLWPAGSRVWGNAESMQQSQTGVSEMNGAAELAPTPPLFAQLPFPSVHPSASTWLGSLHATGHFAHLSAILAGVNHVLSVLSQGIVVLIHCSDGWDRTALLVSLSELCLDSYYRSIEGFIVLVEKEWLSFGHRFQDRLGHGHFSQECSPVFLQFLDCVWQILIQFPSQFQFDSRLLLWIGTQMYSGLYSTFFFNSEEERARNQCHERTRSCWTYVVQHLDEFVNPCYGVGWAHLSPTGPDGEPARPAGYEPLSHFASLPLYADASTLYVDTRDLRFWSDMYMGACASAQGLAWVGNQVPSAGNGGQLVPMHVPAIFSPAPPAAISPGPQHMNASLDLNPTQFVTESRSRAEDLATLQDRLDEATVGAVVQGLVGEVEASSLRAELQALTAASAARERAMRLDFEAELERRVAEATRQAKETHVIRTHEHGLAASPPGTEDLDASQIGLVHNGTGALLQNGSGESTPSASGASSASAAAASSSSSASPSRPSLSISIPALLQKVVTPLLHESRFKDKSSASVCSGGCHQPFAWLRRRPHNCRVCGAVRCDDCAPKRSFRAIRPPQYHSGRNSTAVEEARIVEERICNSCVEAIVRAQNQKINGSDKPTTPIAMRPSASSSATGSPAGASGKGSTTVAASDLFTSAPGGQVVAPASYPGSATLSWFASKALAPFAAGAAAAQRRERMSQFEPRATTQSRDRTQQQSRPRAGSQPHLFGPEKPVNGEDQA